MLEIYKISLSNGEGTRVEISNIPRVEFWIWMF